MSKIFNIRCDIIIQAGLILPDFFLHDIALTRLPWLHLSCVGG